LSQHIRRLFAAAIPLLAAFLVTSAAAAPSPKATLAGSVPSWANSSSFKSATPTADPVNFRVYLGLSSGAATFAQSVSNPASASYGKYLSPSQFLQQFGPSNSDVAAVQQWLRSQGFTVDYTPSNNHYVAADGTAAQVETAFGTQLNQYSVKGKTLRAPSSDLTVPASLGATIAGVIGVDQSSALIRPDIATEPNSGRVARLPQRTAVLVVLGPVHDCGHHGVRSRCRLQQRDAPGLRRLVAAVRTLRLRGLAAPERLRRCQGDLDRDGRFGRDGRRH